MDKPRSSMGSVHFAYARDSQYHTLSGQAARTADALSFGSARHIPDQDASFSIDRKNYPYVSSYFYSLPLPQPAFTPVGIISDTLIKKGSLW